MTHHDTDAIIDWLQYFSSAADSIERYRNALDALLQALEVERAYLGERLSSDDAARLDTLIDQCRAALGREG